MRVPHHTHPARLFRAAAWMYLAPRAAIGILILSMFGLGAFLVLVQVAITFLQRLGA